MGPTRTTPALGRQLRERTGSAGRPLLVTADAGVQELVQRIAAATGVEVDHAVEPTARGWWRTAPLVVIDMALVPVAVVGGLPRRDGVIAVAAAPPDELLLQHCIRLGVERSLQVDSAEAPLIELFSSLAGATGGDGRAVAVVGACGGAGSSILAAALAVAAQRDGRRVLLADCDRWGCGLDVVLGREHESGLRWTDLQATVGRLSPEALHRALPTAGGRRTRIPVLGFDPAAGTELSAGVAEVVLDAARRSGDVAVVDLPRVPSPAGDRMAELADLTVLVVPADVRGCFAARRQAGRLLDLGAEVGVVVRGPSPGGLGAADIAGVLGIPLLAFMRPQPHLARDLEAGRPPGADPRTPLGRAARQVLARLLERAA